jgi:hypothetical protein
MLANHSASLGSADRPWNSALVRRRCARGTLAGARAAQARRQPDRGRFRAAQQVPASECDPIANGIDLSLLEHVSPIEWDNVVLYGQYISADAVS